MNILSLSATAATNAASSVSGVFLDALKIMGLGMLSIFIVMLLIYLVIVILNKYTKSDNKEEE